MIVHLIDGTYELFRHFYGVRRFKKSDPPFGAVAGVLRGVLQIINDGGTHIGVATGSRNRVVSEMDSGPDTRPAPASNLC